MQDRDLAMYAAEADGRPGRELVGGAPQNVFKRITSDERSAGVIRYEKIFAGIKNSDNAPLLGPKISQFAPLAKSDAFVVVWESRFETAHTDSALAAEVATADCYGSAVATAITSGSQTVDVTVKDERLAPDGSWSIFRTGEKVRIVSVSVPSLVTGHEEELTVAGVAKTGETTVRITTTEPIAQDYAEGAKVESILTLGATLAPAVTVPVLNNCAWDHNAQPLVLDNAGTPADTFTLTFSDASHFLCAGNHSGDCGAGDTGSDFSPIDTTISRPLFTLPAGAISGASAGSTVTFTTTPARVPIGEMLVVPAGTTEVIAGTVSTLIFSGDGG